MEKRRSMFLLQVGTATSRLVPLAWFWLSQVPSCLLCWPTVCPGNEAQ
uniref:Cilia and flagella associated protein 100 n=1 Tax=Mus musculus TaxID=10090 RepID=A0A0N4SV62_MOUSE